MIKWIHHILEPHCPECRDEREESKICHSCETLKKQLELLSYERDKLLDRVLSKPEPTPIPEPQLANITAPKFLPWKVRRQLLEQEDREKAALMRKAAQPDNVKDFEKELEDATRERESQKS